MVILVTGGMGFIGSHTAQALADLGDDCVVTSHRTSRDLGDAISTEQVNVADRDAMMGLGDRHAIDGIVHLADPALAHLGDPGAGPAALLADMRAGANGLFNVLECAIAWNVRRVTVASTIGVYGGVPDLRGVSEESPLQLAAGSNVVAASKKSAELVVSLFREHGVDAISVRLPAVWGPRGRKESRFFAAPGLIHAAISGAPPPTTYADDAIDMLYVKDCAKAIALLQTADRLAHSTYNIGSGHATSNADVVAAIKRAIPGAELPLQVGRSPNGAVAYLDTTRLQADTGFEPEYELDRAVTDYLSWLTNQ
ncbi:MAG TPA: NAD(P)-dependent oxidoreductase [Solirubrobacteraceae bacterium]|nr:NAD(P)-dependent oxidoreductase [Solirubrobacteraceae bacterium]